MDDVVMLVEQHERLDALADELIAASRSRDFTPAACAALLCDMAAMLSHHVAAETAYLYDKKHKDAPCDLLAKARAFEREFSALDAPLTRFLERWGDEAIQAERAVFARETTDMMTGLKLRIEVENNFLVPLAFESAQAA